MSHKLKEYIEALEKHKLITSCNIKGEEERFISLATYDSRAVAEGTLFICKGQRFKEEYLISSVEHGACCYVSEKEYEGVSCSFIIVSDIRRAMAVIANLYYDNVWKGLETIGITGTKGKSTTTYFIKSIIDCYENSRNKARCGVLSSIGNYDGIIDEESHLTTPETMELHRHFQNMVQSGIEFAVMEVSSQALKYDRTFGITYDVGCFLNIGEDHISGIEHSDYEDYFSSKLRLFDQCKVMIVNAGSDEQQRLKEKGDTAKALIKYFGYDKACDYYAHDIKTLSDGISFALTVNDMQQEYKIPLHGLFNVDNAMAAISICTELKIPHEYIREGLATAKVDGRMEFFKSPDEKVTCVVDYAHNKMSFETLFSAMKEEFPEHKISIVFGCPGGKALGRRKELGETAGKYADMIWLTEEDAAEESVRDICCEIAEHIGSSAPYFIVEDRYDAIRGAIEFAKSDSANKHLILITGKGRETRMKRGTVYEPTPSDVDFVNISFGTWNNPVFTEEDY